MILPFFGGKKEKKKPQIYIYFVEGKIKNFLAKETSKLKGILWYCFLLNKLSLSEFLRMFDMFEYVR